MHFCIYVLIPSDSDIEELVARVLHPYDEDLEVAPYKVYLDAGEIEAMRKQYGVRRSDRAALVSRLEEWSGSAGGFDEQGLFSIKTFNPKGKWDWYEIGGRWSGRIPGDVISAKALLRKWNLSTLLPAALVTPDGWWHEWETFIVEGWMKWRTERKTGREWLEIVKGALSDHSDMRVVCVDIHR